MVPGPLELAWLIITSIDYIYRNKAGQFKWTAFQGANTSSDAACHEEKHFQYLFACDVALPLRPKQPGVSYPAEVCVPSVQNVGFCGYKESLCKAHLEM